LIGGGYQPLRIPLYRVEWCMPPKKAQTASQSKRSGSSSWRKAAVASRWSSVFITRSPFSCGEPYLKPKRTSDDGCFCLRASWPKALHVIVAKRKSKRARSPINISLTSRCLLNVLESSRPRQSQYPKTHPLASASRVTRCNFTEMIRRWTMKSTCLASFSSASRFSSRKS
jgi:hypothetical protein